MGRITAALLLAASMLLSACGAGPGAAAPTPPAAETPAQTQAPAPAETPAPADPAETPAGEGAEAWTRADEPAPVPDGAAETPAPEASEPPAEPQPCVAIDPGHQSRANLAMEPIGPGSSQMKYKVSGGTWGKTSGTSEYELNLAVSLLLRDELERRGYRVVMTRETNDVDISNIERAAIAEEAGADAFIRIHANGSDDTSVSGAVAICMTASSPFNAALYGASRALSDCVIEAFTAATGAKSAGVWETNTMSGINWSAVPVTILEMGYMTNPQEDLLMADPGYRATMAAGIADGIDRYFERTPPEPSGLDAAPRSARITELETALNAELSRLDSCWDVWAEDCADGSYARCTRNVAAGTPMVSASIIKLFIMGAVYDRIAAGTLSEADVSAYLRYMITVSDNASANTLTGLLGGGDAAAGMAAVNAWAASAGYAGVEFNRLMLDNNGLQNYVTAESCAAILRDIYRGRCVSEEASGKMLELLKDQQVNDRIPAGLPAGTASAHKTGNLAGLCVADVGIVFTGGGDFLLCAICNKPYTDAGATAEIAKLAGMAYAAFAGAA